MIHDLVLRWVVTGLFSLTAAECLLAIVAKRRPWTWVVSHGLHFVMAVAMVVMAWPWGAQSQSTSPAAIFLLAAVTFVTMAIVVARTTALRVRYSYHAVMMLATGWMYAIMNAQLIPFQSNTKNIAQPATSSMPGSDMAGMDMPTSSGSPMWFSAVGWLGTVGFAVAAIFWMHRYFAERQHQPSRSRSLGNLSQAGMAGGMAILFCATLFQI
jgi:Trk-type K+ transport system membrane component